MSRTSEPRLAVAVRLLVLLVTVVAGSGGLGGCTATAADRTGGLELRYERREEPVGLAIWTLETDGILRFAGGRDAILGRESWRGPVSEEDLARLRAVAEGLLRVSATEPAEPAEAASTVRTRLDLRTPEGRRRLRRAGDPSDLEPLLRILQELSAARLDPVLQRLPRPTEPPVAGAREP